MSLDERSREVLRAGRRAEGPSPDDRERVRRKLELAMAMHVPGPEVPPPKFGPSGWASSKLFVSTVATAVIAVGVGGYVATRPAPAEPVAPPAVVAPEPTLAPVEPPVEVAAVNDSAVEPAVEPLERRPPPRGPRPTKRRPTPPSAPDTLSIGAGPAPLLPPSEPEDTLEAETAGLKAIHAELKAQRPAQALALLDQQDRRFPQGQLGPERDAARVLATCASEPTRGADALARFVARHPASPLLTRLKAACTK